MVFGFTSELFLFVFLPGSILIYLIAHYLFKGRADKVVLLVICMLFYAWNSIATFLLFIFLIFATWLLGNCIEFANNSGNAKLAKRFAAAGTVILAGYLFAGKYLGFLVTQIGALFKSEAEFTDILVPLGVSFVIFESISYIIDIYRGDAAAGSVIDAALFISFFPKLLSGPIVLWKDFSGQIGRRNTDIDSVAGGVERIMIGYAKKAIIADTFGTVIANIDAQMGRGVSTRTMWLYVLLYFFQIYYDFSGYSDIAIGLSRIFGFDFKENFNFPYISGSVTEFWRRWHISLGTWFREYVYIPIGGNRRGNVYLHLAVVFVLTGIWHGANWTFLVWGAWNGLLVVLERLLLKKEWFNKIPGILRWFVTMCCIAAGWAVFMSADLNTAFASIGALFSGSPENINFSLQYYLNQKVIILLVIAAAGAFAGVFADRIKTAPWLDSSVYIIIKRIVLLALFVAAVLFTVNSSYSPFLYFQF